MGPVEVELAGADRLSHQGEVKTHALPDGSILLFTPHAGAAIPLNASGAAIWTLCDGTRSVDEIVGQLAEDYDAPRDQIETDSRRFLAEMTRLGLLERVS